MSITIQRDLFPEGITQDDVDALKVILRRRGWSKRVDLSAELDWSERKIRLVATAAGKEVLRGPRGFNLTRNCTAEEIKLCAERFHKQAIEMDALHVGWLQIAHQMVG